MKKILIFKTASENVMNQLFNDLDTDCVDKYCLIQSSSVDNYTVKYPKLNLIDIHQEGFYNLSEKVLQEIKMYFFDIIYIPTTSTRANNFGNILEIIVQLNYRQIVFFNCNGEISVVKKKSKLQEKLISVYINLIDKIHLKG